MNKHDRFWKEWTYLLRKRYVKERGELVYTELSNSNLNFETTIGAIFL